MDGRRRGRRRKRGRTIPLYAEMWEVGIGGLVSVGIQKRAIFKLCVFLYADAKCSFITWGKRFPVLEREILKISPLNSISMYGPALLLFPSPSSGRGSGDAVEAGGGGGGDDPRRKDTD